MPVPQQQPSQLPPAPTVTSARAMYGYQASTPQEINLQPGEIILVLRKSETGWWYGRNSTGAQGAFPATFVSELTQPPASPIAPMSLQPSATQIYGAPQTANSPIAQQAARPVQKMFALQPFTASKPEELSIPSGTAVNVHYQQSPEYYFGELNGRTGIFPCWVFQQASPAQEFSTTSQVQTTQSAPEISTSAKVEPLAKLPEEQPTPSATSAVSTMI